MGWKLNFMDTSIVATARGVKKTQNHMQHQTNNKLILLLSPTFWKAKGLFKYVSSQYLNYNSLTVEYMLGQAGPWHINTCLWISDNQYESEHWWWKVTYFSSLVLGGKITFRKKSKMHFWQKKEYHRCIPCFFFFSSFFKVIRIFILYA